MQTARYLQGQKGQAIRGENLRRKSRMFPDKYAATMFHLKLKRNMKAFNIIDELTRDSYENNGTFTADEASTMYPYLQQMFGKEIEVV